MQTEGRLSSNIVAVIVVVASLTGGASAGCSACGGGSTWMGGSSMGISWAEQTLETGTTTSAGSSSSAGTSAAADGEEVDGSASAISPEALFIDQNGERRLVAAFVGVPGEASYIEGSIHLPLDQVFAEDGGIKSSAEIAAIFGAAGIAETDPLVIYGDSFVNGYDTFAFWVMSYLGHEEVLLLEGTRADREAAGLEFVSAPAVRAAVAYNSTPNLGLLTVESELADEQLVDPRTPAEFSAGHLDGAINVDSTTVIGIDGLASDSALAQAFRGLEKDEPVVVYSSRGGVASIVWYALFDQGFVPSIMIVG